MLSMIASSIDQKVSTRRLNMLLAFILFCCQLLDRIEACESCNQYLLDISKLQMEIVPTEVFFLKNRHLLVKYRLIYGFPRYCKFQISKFSLHLVTTLRRCLLSLLLLGLKS